jgi:hypothetical protein
VVKNLRDGQFKAIDSIIKKLGLNIMMILIQYVAEPVKDRFVLEDTKQICHFKNKIFTASKYLSPELLKFIFSCGQAILCARQHSMVFFLSEGVPTCVVELDEYYKMKLLGVDQEFPNICIIISIKKENLDKEIVDKIVNLIKQRGQNV